MESINNKQPGKRKKKVPKCPNPLFIIWLTEWKNEAAERGIKSQYTYQKALNALKKFPVRLESGKECKVLEGFGDKICKMLDDKLAEYIADGAGSLSVESEDEAGDARKPKQRKKSQKQDNMQMDRGKHAERIHGREYIPQYRSGAYALILTLYTNLQAGERDMKKSDLMREAQPLSDKDFMRPDPGCRYTSWSSMGTLIKKGYVIKQSSPARYSLTDRGSELAARLQEVGQNQTDCCSDAPLGFHFPEQPPPPLPRQGNHSPELQRPSDRVPAHCISDDEDDGDDVQPLCHDRYIIPDVTASSHGLKFAYISDSGAEVTHKDQAVVHIDDSMFVGFLIRSKYEDLLLSGLRYTVETTRSSSSPGEIFAYLHNDDAPERSNPITPKPEAKPAKPEPKQKQQKPKSPMKPSSSSCLSPPKEPMRALPSRLPPLPRTNSSSSLLSIKGTNSASYPPSLSGDSQSQDSQSLLTEWAEPLITMHPGTFDIVLCVDNREVFGSGTTGKEALMKELQKNRILMDIRVLQIGDFLWIARPKGAGNDPKREVVLDYVVERKRMDDLASSITDGRFREQKFRLKNCQLRKPIYLVEDYGSTQHFSIPEDTLKQAITNTQVTDDFYVKRTRDIKESASYLTIMTRYLQSNFSQKTLYGCLRKHLPKIKHSLGDRELRLMTFEDYDKTTVKTRPLMIREMFAKQLCQIAGMTPEKALAITELYPTPACLIQAYKRCIGQKEKEQLLLPIKFGPTKRGVGPQMSKIISMLYTTEAIR